MQYFLHPHNVLSPVYSILRQELDSMIRVIYLLSVSDLTERQRLIDSTLQGVRWKIQTSKGKWRDVTDREMVNMAQRLQGWTQSVYKFGCAFIHLSDFHNHLAESPFEKLSKFEKKAMLYHLRYYHGGPSCDNPDMMELSSYLPQVFEKIASNLEIYIKQLELNEELEGLNEVALE